MAVSAEKIGPLSGSREISRSFPVNACFPVPVKVAVAFTAEAVALSEANELSIVKAELITVFYIVTVEAPPHRFCVMDFDVGMFFFELSFFSVHLHGGMTTATGENPFRKGRGGDGKFLAGRPGRSR
jgi:hypothetical protein